MGGILGADERGIVTEFYWDNTGITTEKRYTPDVAVLNEVISEWAKASVGFVGFVHSHPSSTFWLSATDTVYAKKIKSVCGMSEVLMLIYIPADGEFFQYVI